MLTSQEIIKSRDATLTFVSCSRKILPSVISSDTQLFMISSKICICPHVLSFVLQLEDFKSQSVSCVRRSSFQVFTYQAR